MTRGYVAIGLYRPKCTANLGGVLRAAECYGANLVILCGQRMGKYSTDTTKAWRRIPCVEVNDLLEHVPFGAMPVAVEICERAKPLPSATHPERAFYIFGPEDGSVPKSILERVPLVVSVPTNGCMNLAATANVVLYDRMVKRAELKGE
jgi:tRNA(Leu) C34 or U34 (ribose-2'-O)-methylase TrmL